MNLNFAKLRKLASCLAALCILSLASCNTGNSGGSNANQSGGGSNMVTPIAVPTNNAYITIKVSEVNSLCGQNPNIPCTSVTICSPDNPNNCQTIDNILVDTGSYGLSLFASQVRDLNLPVESATGLSVAECISYGGGQSTWGPVALAKIDFAPGVNANEVPIQLIDSGYPGKPSGCSNAISQPGPQYNYNGILGVGPLINNNGSYYMCNGTSCTLTPNMPPLLQASNPIASISNESYSNGITLKLPPVGANGGINAVGYLIFGVGTESNNAVSETANVYSSTSYTVGYPIGMSTQYNGEQLSGFLDTGSNGLFYTDNNIDVCSGWYCPSSDMALQSSNQNIQQNYIQSSINIGNSATLFNTSNTAFSNLGGTFDYGIMDYGLPYFFGKTVHIVIDGATAPGISQTGPYWAF